MREALWAELLKSTIVTAKFALAADWVLALPGWSAETAAIIAQSVTHCDANPGSSFH